MLPCSGKACFRAVAKHSPIPWLMCYHAVASKLPCIGKHDPMQYQAWSHAVVSLLPCSGVQDAMQWQASFHALASMIPCSIKHDPMQGKACFHAVANKMPCGSKHVCMQWCTNKLTYFAKAVSSACKIVYESVPWVNVLKVSITLIISQNKLECFTLV
jgi:hypothetical protein